MAKAKKKAPEKAPKRVVEPGGESRDFVTLADLDLVIERLESFTKLARGYRLLLETKGGKILAWKVAAEERGYKGYRAYLKGVEEAVTGKKLRHKEE